MKTLNLRKRAQEELKKRYNLEVDVQMDHLEEDDYPTETHGMLDSIADRWNGEVFDYRFLDRGEVEDYWDYGWRQGLWVRLMFYDFDEASQAYADVQEYLEDTGLNGTIVSYLEEYVPEHDVYRSDPDSYFTGRWTNMGERVYRLIWDPSEAPRYTPEIDLEMFDES